jgi:hypothetical protein
METTEEGMAVAQATRETIKRKHQEVVKEVLPTEDQQQPDSKKQKEEPAPKPPCIHEVAIPKDYDPASKELDPATYGAWQQRADSCQAEQQWAMYSRAGHSVHALRVRPWTVVCSCVY